MRANTSNIRSARVIQEDKDFLILEIAKQADELVQVHEGDKFYAVIFVRPDGNQTMQAWVPWENEM